MKIQILETIDEVSKKLDYIIDRTIDETYLSKEDARKCCHEYVATLRVLSKVLVSAED